jgi:putative ABC transport system permease protein
MQAFVDETKKLASAKRVAFSQGIPCGVTNNYTMPVNSKAISFRMVTGDSAYYEMLGLNILQEKNQESQYYLSQQAVKVVGEAAGPEFDINKPDITLNKSMRMSGIIQDIQFGNITNDLEPALFMLSDKFAPWNILVEVQGDPNAAFGQVKQLYEQIAGTEFSGQFIDELVAKSFAPQKRTSQIIIVFTCIAILISLLGLLAMSMYFIRQRIKEIAVRKVFGASSSEVLIRLLRTFMVYVAVAFVVALPVSWYIMRWWLDGYSYRIGLSPLIFAAAGVFCFAVSLVTVFWQSRIAASTNPANIIKN